ncbi:hypothetical protein [Winogradskyella sp.]|uniref:hypothetical protein n=1 Tax=Winogradskyella sp. TaxID=1883156 RepID=UPI003AB4918A
MKVKKLQLIDENSSPLFRVMSIYNSDSPNKVFANNICAFHIGNGIIISVAHNLRVVDRLPSIISDDFYQNQLRIRLDVANQVMFDQHYQLIAGTNQRMAIGINPGNGEMLAQILDNFQVDRRFINLYATNSCKPYLVTTFRNNSFCGNATLNAHFNANRYFPEPSLNRHTFLIELELLDELITDDIAIYRIINTHSDIINNLPVIDIDFGIYDTGSPNFYCLQAAPYDNLGRIINEARIEGLLDNFAQEQDLLGHTYRFEGLRYMMKGYFRFGSSGAPYIVYDNDQEVFKVNAIQSQASFIQLAINNNREGNLQYVNGIATPLNNVEHTINSRLSEIH